MDSDRLNRWLTLGANLGVLVGILLLVVELQQNREMMRAQTRNEITQGALALLSLTATNQKLAELVVRSNNGEDLSPSERFMYISRSESVFRHFENAHYQYRHGMFDEVEYQKQLSTQESVISRNPGLVEYWCSFKSMYSEPFAAEIDKLLDEDACR